MEQRISPTSAEIRECEQRLHKVEGRERSLWITAFSVAGLLTLGVVLGTVSPEESGLPAIYGPGEREVLLRSLSGVVLLFCVFAVYHRHVLERLRYEVNDHLLTLRTLEIRNQILEELAIVDPVTGLFNRRYFNERIPAELMRADRMQHSVVALAIDINEMKQINDTYGHAAGDAALVELARRMRKAVRSSDSAIRMGGDEFLIVLCECDDQQVRTVLERLQQISVQNGRKSIPVKFSCGWAKYQPGESAAELCQRADEDLYAKKGKRPLAAAAAASAPAVQ